MLGVRHLALITGLALAAPSAAIAQVRPQWNAPSSTAYNEGFARGRTAGAEDFRRGQRFNFADETDYRRGDYGYRSQYGNRDRYRDDFRRGFAEGYRAGYARTDFRSTPYYTPAPAPTPYPAPATARPARTSAPPAARTSTATISPRRTGMTTVIARA